MTRLPKKRGITQVGEDKSPILRRKKQYFHAIAVIGFGNTNREKSMKIKSLFVAVLLMAGVVVAPASAEQFEWPKVESFTVSTGDIDIAQGNPTLDFTLVVSHFLGISSTWTQVNLSNNLANTILVARLTRVDNPVDLNLKKVTFKGSLKLPSSLPAGLYSFTAESVSALSNTGAAGSLGTGTITPADFNSFPGAEKSIVVRSNGELNYDFQTFVGPTHSAQNSATDGKPRSINTTEPIWKVGEKYNVAEHFELRTNLVSLSISTNTPLVCTSDGKIIKFIAEGSCSYSVFTPKTKDYLYKSLEITQTISAARQKQVIGITSIGDQKVTSYPTTIVVVPAYTTIGILVVPDSLTTKVCTATGNGVRLISSGTCSLNYQVSATSSQLASDLYSQSFKVSKDGEVLVTPTPEPTPTATPTPVATAKPVVKKTITCIKGKKTVKKTAISPKCPSGYKLKK